MSYICGMTDCKRKSGPCIHELIIIVLIVLIVIERLIRFGG